jgi:hypothetical protein
LALALATNVSSAVAKRSETADRLDDGANTDVSGSPPS